MSRLSLAVLLLLGSVTTNTLAAQEVGQNSEPVLRARPIADSAAIRLDGALDEAAWQDGDIASGFRQQEPEEGAPASEPTQIRVLYDHENLYIGVWAFDSRPDRIIARQLERDAQLGLSRFGPSGGDDAIELILDTFHDRRNAYYFGTNPQGIQVDGLITDESHEPDLDWDGVWDVRARTTNDGWTAEFAIPLRTLRFPANAGEQTWGFNVQRVVARKNEQSLWTAWSREGEGLHRVSRAGELDGLDSLRRGLDLSVKPYVLTSVGQDYLERPSGSADFEPDVGLDAKLGLASGLVLDVTVNTDFAQVEADEEQVDLSRFSLFFPEKREFFLENAGIFEFGAPHFHGPPPLLLFFSRRIGLQQAQTVPIIAGTRLTGRAGAQTIGLLNVTTAEEESVGAPLTNFAV
ncbi:MAG: carbohydrate binding family 9 domain-containing protein, partial [Gemmatimonadota bacterium]